MRRIAHATSGWLARARHLVVPWTILGASAFLVLVYAVVRRGVLDADALNTAGTLAAALASAAAASAAWRAARESSSTAKDAIEALGLAMKPALDVEMTTQYDGDSGSTTRVLILRNVSSWDAVDIDVLASPAYGQEESFHLERLSRATSDAPGYTQHGGAKAWTMRAPQAPEPDANLLGADERQEWTDKVEVLYSDERRSLRWRMVSQRISEIGRQGPITTAGGRSVVTVERDRR